MSTLHSTDRVAYVDGSSGPASLLPRHGAMLCRDAHGSKTEKPPHLSELSFHRARGMARHLMEEDSPCCTEGYLEASFSYSLCCGAKEA